MACGVACVLTAALLLAGSYWASAQDSDVIELDSANFDDIVADLDVVLVEFYAPW